MEAKRKTPDWQRIRTEYVNGHASLGELAHKHGVTKAAIDKRASREKWSADRQRKSAEVSARVSDQLTEQRTSDLAKFNEDDLTVARAIRATVATKIAELRSNGGSPSDLRALASAAESAQRIGRLALGATTGNQGHSAPDGGAIPFTSVPIDQYLQAREQALKDFL